MTRALIRSCFLHIARRRLRCVFVLSTGRCGTQTLAQLLDASPDIDAHHEPKPFFLKDTLNAYENARADDAFAKSFTRKYLLARLCTRADTQSMRRTLWAGRCYAESANRLTYVAADLARFLPRSKFVFLHRDPAAVVRSCMRRAFYSSGHAWDKKRIVPRPGTAAAQEWSGWNNFQRVCWYWNEVNILALDFIRSLPPERRFILPSAHLFDPSSTSISELFAWCEARPPAPMVVRDILSLKLNRQRDGVFPTAESWSSEQLHTFQSIAKPAMCALGYSERHET